MPLWKTVLGQKSILFFGPKIWPKINNDLKNGINNKFFYSYPKERNVT